jgi:hypothetical protein
MSDLAPAKRVPRPKPGDTLALTRAHRALLLSAISFAGSLASLFFNEAFAAFCGL